MPSLPLVAAAVFSFAWPLTQAAADGEGAEPLPPSADSSERLPGGAGPSALVLADRGRLLFVADRGSIVVVNTAENRIIDRIKVGRKIADSALSPDGRFLLAVDEATGELLVIPRKKASLGQPIRVKVPPFPVSVRVAADSRKCSVASLWSRRVTLIDLPGPDAGIGSPRIAATANLPFAPRFQIHLPGSSRVVVADSFAGSLAVLSLETGKLESIRQLPAHNIRGMALTADGKGLLVSHQVANLRGTTSRDDLHWGNLISNGVRELNLAEVDNPRGDILRGSRLHRLGEVGRGAGDPAGVAGLAGGRMIVALSGVGEAALGNGKGDWQRFSVGTRPTAVIVDPDGRRAYVANSLGGSISALDLATRKATEIPLHPPAKPTRLKRGEMLFHDAKLSLGGWFSCQSCHTDGHSNGLAVDTLQDGSHGTLRRIPSLLGVKDTGPWTWNGSVPDLRKQVCLAVESTMGGKKLSPEREADLLEYLRSLAPAPSLSELRGTIDAAKIARGRKVFARENCGRCHAPPTFTSQGTHAVGKEAGKKSPAFNPPSLRGVSQSGAYLHHGRVRDLRDLFLLHRHQVPPDFHGRDLADLLAYLESL